MTIDTSEGTKEFRPRRLVWQKPSQFSVSGLNHAGHLTRVVLRFKAAEDAKTAAAGLLETGTVIEEPLPLPAVEIEAVMTLQIPLVSIFWIIVVLVLAVGLFPRNLDLGALAAWGIGLILLIGLRLVLLLPLFIRKEPAWIRKECELVLLRTLNWSTLLQSLRVEWKDSRTFSLKTGRRRVKLSFRTSEDALAAVQFLKPRSELETSKYSQRM